MGRTAARMFAAEGARVVCVDVTEEMAESAAAEVTAAGGQATAVAADVSKEDEAKRMVDHAVATFGRVDALYNNAGIMPAADHSVIDTDVETWDKVMAVNVRGVYPRLQVRDPEDGRAGLGLDHQRRVVRRDPRLLRAAGRLHGLEGRGPRADEEPRRPVRAAGRPDERDLARARSRRRC